MSKLENYWVINGKPVYLVGINYQTAEYGHFTDHWEDEAAAEIIEKDFQYMKEMGIDAIRIQSAKFHRERTFATILKYARKYGIYVMPNVNLGEAINADEPLWFKSQSGDVVTLSKDGRNSQVQTVDQKIDPFVEPALSREVAFIKWLLSTYKDEEMILAWDICNEPTYSLYFGSICKYGMYCGKDFNTAVQITTHWARTLYRAAKEADPNHPITIGTDHSMIVMDTGFNLFDFSEANDFMSTHGYSKNASGFMLLDEVGSLRDTYFPAFIARFSQITGKPMASGECGNTSYVMSEENQGHHYRAMLFSGLINGCIGVFPWCFHAYDIGIERIHKGYETGPSEAEFGIVRPDHTDKPAGQALRRFAQLVKKIDLTRFALAAPDVGILVPRSYYDVLDEHKNSLFHAFVLAKQAHLNVTLVLATDDLSKYKLLIIPSTHLTVSEMDRVKDFVQAGGSVCCSLTHGLGGTATYLKDVLGFIVEDYIPAPAEMKVNFVKDFGGFRRGDQLLYRSDTWSYYVAHEKPENKRQYLSLLKPLSAEVLAQDQFAHPVVLLNRLGQSRILSFAFGVEYYLSNMPGVFATDRTHELYRALADAAGLKPEADCDSPNVEVGLFQGEKKSLVFAVNHERFPVDAQLQFRCKPKGVRDFESGHSQRVEDDGQVNLHLERNEVKIFEVGYSQKISLAF